MPVVETCGVCGLDLHFVPGFKDGRGEYLHVFTSEKVGWYKSIHLPVPVLQDELFEQMKKGVLNLKEEVFVPAQGWSGEKRQDNDAGVADRGLDENVILCPLCGRFGCSDLNPICTSITTSVSAR